MPNLLKTAIGNDNSRNPEFSYGHYGRGSMTMFPHLKNLDFKWLKLTNSAPN